MKMRLKIIGILTISAFAWRAAAQPTQQLPVDPKVRTGVLDNGLTYYIRHNELPKQRAEFYIAQRVGSMQEEDSQRGLAHFLEHIAFNGTTHFPDKTMLEYLESIGVKFGTNINAYTSFDETVYTLMNVPVGSQSTVDSCLLVLYDWSCGITLADQEIDKERGVIREEWRTRQDAQERIWEQILPVIFPGSRYGNRLPIGLMEVIDNFPYQMLRDYYHKWYRPDLQGIIVVGDVDVDRVEAKIKELFNPIPLDPARVERVYYGVPDNEEPIVAFAKDKEATNVRASVYYKHPAILREIRNTPDFFLMSYFQSVISSILNTRLSELLQKADAPYLNAGVYYGPILGITATQDAFTTTVISDENRIEPALRALLTETRRADQHGFTEAEYDRAKASLLSSVESAYNEREKQYNSTYAQEYTRAFTESEPIPGIETEYELYQAIAAQIPLEAVNEFVRGLITDQNILITLQGPDKEGVNYPSKAELLALLSEISKENTEPYAEELFEGPLVSDLPAPGRIVREEADTLFGAAVWTLSNGAKVVLKPTNLKSDQIRLLGFSKGGYSLMGSEYNTEIKLMDNLASLGGLGSFSATDLRKALAGKKASVSISIDETVESIGGTCAPKDLETLMQLVYLNFTALRQDDEAFASWQTRMAAMLRNSAATPEYVYQDSLYGTLYDHNPRKMNPTAEEIENVRYGKALDLIRSRFNASDFTFIFVGNLDPETLRPAVEKYIACLPSGTPITEKGAGTPTRIIEGKKDIFFEKTVESPKVTTTVVISATLEPTLENYIGLDALAQILRSRYLETMREDEGGTYGTSVGMGFSVLARQQSLDISFDTNIDQYKRLDEIVMEEFEKIIQEGPADVDFKKVKEYMLKNNSEQRQGNGYWLSFMNTYYIHGRDYVTGYAQAVNAMTPADIQTLAKALLSQGNRIHVTMNGVVAK